MSVRDSQRSKVYAAERAAGIYRHRSEAMDWDGVLAFVEKVQSSAYVRRKYSASRYQVKAFPGRGGGMAMRELLARDIDGYWMRHHGQIITLGVWARQPAVILHEIAHHYAGLSHSHDWAFCATFLDLVRHFMGKEAHDALKAQFKAHRVRFTPPRPKRTLTPEQREAASARLALAREARAAKRAQEAAA